MEDIGRISCIQCNRPYSVVPQNGAAGSRQAEFIEVEIGTALTGFGAQYGVVIVQDKKSSLITECVDEDFLNRRRIDTECVGNRFHQRRF